MFLHWWAQQLIEMLPPAPVRAAAGRSDGAILELDGELVTLHIRKDGVTAVAARNSADEAGYQALAETMSKMEKLPRQLILRLPAAAILRKRVQLPLSARRDLASLL